MKMTSRCARSLQLQRLRVRAKLFAKVMKVRRAGFAVPLHSLRALVGYARYVAKQRAAVE